VNLLQAYLAEQEWLSAIKTNCLESLQEDLPCMAIKRKGFAANLASTGPKRNVVY